MISLEKIKEIYQEAADKKWPYPYLFNSLKSIGVERYETNVLTHEIKYVGGGAAFVDKAPEGFTPLKAAEKFDLEALKAALGRVQRQETNYIQFLTEIAAAGVAFYRVDMRPRTVTYHGPGKDKLVETVPDTK
jgi:uncharacterized protein YbcV (DUF1398 family)